VPHQEQHHQDRARDRHDIGRDLRRLDLQSLDRAKAEIAGVMMPSP